MVEGEVGDRDEGVKSIHLKNKWVMILQSKWVKG